MTLNISRGIYPEGDSDDSGLARNIYFRQISVSPRDPCHSVPACEDTDRSLFPIFHVPERFAMPTTTMINIDAAIAEVESAP